MLFRSLAEDGEPGVLLVERTPYAGSVAAARGPYQ
jgi:hypothetical protein